MIILLHSSKTMRRPAPTQKLSLPALLPQAEKLAAYIKTLSPETLAKVMQISPALALKTKQTFAEWSGAPAEQSAAMDSFVGDIYSGLRATDLSPAERAYADQNLRILSGLYGILKPLDGVMPYRLEMAYKFPDSPYDNLYTLWDKAVAEQLSESGLILNLAAVEYSKLVTPYVDPERIIAPRFLTMNPKTNEPTFVVVHAKIARGAFARWVIQQHIEDESVLRDFTDIGYRYDAELSTRQEPVFVCQEFGGKGLSMRLR